MALAAPRRGGLAALSLSETVLPVEAAALAAGFWMFGYLPLVVASFALETSLYCVVFLLSYSVYLGESNRACDRRRENGTKPDSRDESPAVWSCLGLVSLGAHRRPSCCWPAWSRGSVCASLRKADFREHESHSRRVAAAF